MENGITPEAASPLPLKGATLADRRSRLRGVRLGALGDTSLRMARTGAEQLR
jgi:hypothetical protein